jgi:hypothetical protein
MFSAFVPIFFYWMMIYWCASYFYFFSYALSRRYYAASSFVRRFLSNAPRTAPPVVHYCLLLRDYFGLEGLTIYLDTVWEFFFISVTLPMNFCSFLGDTSFGTLLVIIIG